MPGFAADAECILAIRDNGLEVLSVRRCPDVFACSRGRNKIDYIKWDLITDSGRR